LRVDVTEALSVLTKHPGILLHMSRADFETMIQSAARNNLAQVRLMAHCAFDLGGFGEAGATALHVAAWHGHVDVVRLLLDYHAPVNALDVTYGSSPLSWAIHGSKKNIAFLLSRPDAPHEYPRIIAALRDAGGKEITGGNRGT